MQSTQEDKEIARTTVLIVILRDRRQDSSRPWFTVGQLNIFPTNISIGTVQKKYEDSYKKDNKSFTTGNLLQ
jgi:hypothetical protein